MSKIIRPFGKVCQRIIIEADETQTLKVVAVNIDLLTNAEVTMGPLEAMRILTKFTFDMLGMLIQMQRGQKPSGLILEGNDDDTKATKAN